VLPTEIAAAAGRLTAELSERGLAEIILLLVASRQARSIASAPS
jgi:hypothetical protein